MDSVYGGLPGLSHAHLNHPMPAPANNGFSAHYSPANLALSNLTANLLNNQAAALQSGAILNNSSASTHGLNNGVSAHPLDVNAAAALGHAAGPHGGSPGLIGGGPGGGGGGGGTTLDHAVLDHVQQAMNNQQPPQPQPHQQQQQPPPPPPPQSAQSGIVHNGNSLAPNQWSAVNGNGITMEEEKRDKEAIYGYVLCSFPVVGRECVFSFVSSAAAGSLHGDVVLLFSTGRHFGWPGAKVDTASTR